VPQYHAEHKRDEVEQFEVMHVCQIMCHRVVSWRRGEVELAYVEVNMVRSRTFVCSIPPCPLLRAYPVLNFERDDLIRLHLDEDQVEDDQVNSNPRY